MSKVKCDYCDSVFEYTNQTSCPACGASLGGNKQVEELNEAQAKQEAYKEQLSKEAALRAREMMRDNLEQQNRVGRFVRIFAIIVMLIIIMGFIITFLSQAAFFGHMGGIFS